jgi:SpoVK/Ycf46/Vps4 family AAA+-type ATPase
MEPKLGDMDISHVVCKCTTCSRLRKNKIGELPKSSGGELADLLAEQRAFCPPRVFGFAVRQKTWVQMLVDNVKEVRQKDKEEAFKNLELDKKTKDLLKNLVTEHARSDSAIDDLIPGKGNGLIVLLHGPPGVGKTLTAESLAMLSNKPLYSVSMSDIGTSPTTVERNFGRIFELATHWKALLLFDEADVFLQSRTLDDLRRNSLVSILIRTLEYFQGILFLTSNRVKIFDEAFQSRIHVAIRYKELSGSQRAKIWNMWIRKAGDKVDDRKRFEDELEEGGDLYRAELNGRQIRSVFRSAMSLANAELGNKKLKWDHVQRVLNSTIEFSQYMVQNEDLARRQGLR